jgi:hypothetical protein
VDVRSRNGGSGAMGRYEASAALSFGSFVARYEMTGNVNRKIATIKLLSMNRINFLVLVLRLTTIEYLW